MASEPYEVDEALLDSRGRPTIGRVRLTLDEIRALLQAAEVARFGQLSLDPEHHQPLDWARQRLAALERAILEARVCHTRARK